MPLGLRSASTQQKNNALNNIATQVDKNRKGILNANQKDLEQSKNNGLDTALLLFKALFFCCVLALRSVFAAMRAF
jgi:gamma-glutamyl phosphate reductase